MATSTKQKLQEGFDVTNQEQAQTAEDVNNQDSRTRLWQSLKTGYDYQKENTTQAFDQNKSAADRAALQRGMGRSSYNLQTMANIDTEKAKALSQIDSNLIADYQNRLTQLEQQEAENERWEREFAANREDAAWSKGFQQQQADISQSNWQQEFAANRSDTAWSQGMQEKQFGFTQQQWQDQQNQWKAEFDFNSKTSSEQLAFNYVTTAAANGGDVSDALLKQAGISRKDYNAMKKTVTTKSSGGGSRKPKPDDTKNDDGEDQMTPEKLMNILMNNGEKYTGVTGYDESTGNFKSTYDPKDLARRGIGNRLTQSTD